MEIYLIRHHEPVIENGVCYGQTDVPVKNPHFDDIQNIISQLPKTVHGVYCSPLSRCKDVLLLIYPKDKIEIDSRLMELNFGDWEMKKWEDIDQKQLFNWMENYQTQACPNGESYQDLKLRAINFLNFIKKNHLKKDKIVIYTHSGWIKVIMPILNSSVSVDEAMSLKIGYNEVIKVVF